MWVLSAFKASGVIPGAFSDFRACFSVRGLYGKLTRIFTQKHALSRSLKTAKTLDIARKPSCIKGFRIGGEGGI
jgi:hypothetical protein